MTQGPMSFGQDNNAGADQTRLRSAQPLAANPADPNALTATLMVHNTGTGNAIVGYRTGAGAGTTAAVAGLNPGGVGVAGDSETGRGVVGGSGMHDGVLGTSIQRNGVQGTSSSTVASGVYGENLSDGGYGVAGRIVSNQGGVDSNAVYGENNGYGAGVRGYSANGYAGVFIGTPSNGAPPATAGGLFVRGEIVKTGGDFAEAMPHPDGSMRRMYAPLSPESFYEDFGRDELVEGRCHVPLDPDFVAVLGLDHGDYHVFLTPEGESQGLFVSDRRADGFDVREQQGGNSTLTFSYRLVAARNAGGPKRMAPFVAQQELLGS